MDINIHPLSKKENCQRQATGLPPDRTLDMRAGPLHLQDRCPAWLVEQLRAESGLRAFAHNPEREHQLLLSVAKRPDSKLTLAYTPEGEIVAQITLAPVDDWWQGMENVYEIAIEVSVRWRRQGVAQQLAKLALADPVVEEMIILAMGLVWHWDLKGLNLSRFAYRELLRDQTAAFGFVEYLTSEPNVSMDPANILLARIGRHVSQPRINQFFQCLLRSGTLPGQA